MGGWEDEKVSRVQSAWGIGLKADVGRRRKKKVRSWEDEKVGRAQSA